jgi:excisionase family DNA binding protein
MQGIQDTPQLLLLNIPQVMQLLGLSRSKVHKLIKREGLPVKYFGRAVRISPTELEQWLKER